MLAIIRQACHGVLARPRTEGISACNLAAYPELAHVVVLGFEPNSSIRCSTASEANPLPEQNRLPKNSSQVQYLRRLTSLTLACGLSAVLSSAAPTRSTTPIAAAAPPISGETCAFTYSVTTGPQCGPWNVYVQSASTYSAPNCGGCSGSVNAVLTTSPVPIWPPPDPSGPNTRVFSVIGSGDCGGTAATANIPCPTTGLTLVEIVLNCTECD